MISICIPIISNCFHFCFFSMFAFGNFFGFSKGDPPPQGSTPKTEKKTSPKKIAKTPVKARIDFSYGNLCFGEKVEEEKVEDKVEEISHSFPQKKTKQMKLVIGSDEFRFGEKHTETIASQVSMVSQKEIETPPPRKIVTPERKRTPDNLFKSGALRKKGSGDIYEDIKSKVVGNDAAVKNIVRWFSARIQEKPDTPAALLLVGPPGCGKTTVAKMVVQQFNMTTMSLMSDAISLPEAIEKIMNLSMTESFGKPRSILCDNFDVLVDRKRGPPQEKGTKRPLRRTTLTTLLNFLKEAPSACSPIVFIAPDLSKPEIRSLSEKCLKIEFKELNYSSLRELAAMTVRRLHLPLEDKNIKHVIDESNGDGRRLVNELQWMCRSSSPSKLEAGVIEKCDASVFNLTKLLLQASLTPLDCLTVLRRDDRLSYMLYDSCYTKIGPRDRERALRMARIWAYSDRGPTSIQGDIGGVLVSSNIPSIRRRVTRNCFAKYTQMFKWREGVKKRRETLRPLCQRFMGSDADEMMGILYLFQEMNTKSKTEKRKRGDLTFGKMFQITYGVPFNSYRSMQLLGD